MIFRPALSTIKHLYPRASFATTSKSSGVVVSMSQNKRPSTTNDQPLLSLSHPDSQNLHTPIVDTHTHLLATYEKYLQSYRSATLPDIFAFVRGTYGKEGVETRTDAIVDVWCEAPVTPMWKEIADSALTEEDRKAKWNDVNYWFVMGVHPHDARAYDDSVENDILKAMQHPRCVGWGEIGLDYKVSRTPRDIQHKIFERQLRHAVKLSKPLTIHTREAEEDTERILKAEVPVEHPIHVHCYTDSPELAERLLNHFPNLYIGITGVITYSSNLNTSAVIRLLASPSHSMRILLETDAPFMIPSNISKSIRGKLRVSHTGMIPWTAEWVAKVANEVDVPDGTKWTAERVMSVSRANARKMYGV